MNEERNYNKYEEIPEGASDQVMDSYLKSFLREKKEIVTEKGVLFALEQLENIAEHEIMGKYESSDIAEVSNFIRECINYNDDETMDIILSIVMQMHLESVWYEMVQENNIKNEDVKDLIAGAIKENEEYKYFN